MSHLLYIYLRTYLHRYILIYLLSMYIQFDLAWHIKRAAHMCYFGTKQATLDTLRKSVYFSNIPNSKMFVIFKNFQKDPFFRFPEKWGKKIIKNCLCIFSFPEKMPNNNPVFIHQKINPNLVFSTSYGPT